MEDIELYEVNEESETFSVLKTYGEDLTAKKYITNPAIARDEEIRKLILVLLTPDKSALLIGKAGIGKTAIVEGLAYLIQQNKVPDAIKGYRVVKINSTSLVGKIIVDNKEEMAISMLMRELKNVKKTILFIDEVHTLIGGKSDGPMDLANILKPALDRGDIKAIGATTTIEYETYVVRDRAFLRRFERIDVPEPDEKTTVEILFKSLPRIEYKTGAKFKYNELAAMYPDVAFSVLSAAFSNAVFQNRKEVNVLDVYNAIKTSKRIYPATIIKELDAFRENFKSIAIEDGLTLPLVLIEDLDEQEGIM